MLASRVLGITLTRRGRHLGDPIPMAGIPLHTRDTYLGRLLRAGHKVVVCDQVEPPGRSPGIVKREVTRVVTPGTLTEDSMLADRPSTFLASVCVAPAVPGGGPPAPRSIAWLDLSSGQFFTQPTSVHTVVSDLSRYPPAELLVPSFMSAAAVSDPWLRSVLSRRALGLEDCVVTFCDTSVPFDAGTGRNLLLDTLVAPHAADQVKTLPDTDVAAAGALLHYVQWTQRGNLPSMLWSPPDGASAVHLTMDVSTRRSLEITDTVDGKVRQVACGFCYSCFCFWLLASGALIAAAVVAVCRCYCRCSLLRF